MLRKFAIILVFCFMLSSIGCGKINNNASNDTKDTAFEEIYNQSSQNNLNNVINSNNQNSFQIDINYKFVTEYYSNGDVKINYPQISNIGNDDKLKKVNDVIKTEALKVLYYYGTDYSKLKLDVDYKIIMKAQSLLSIQYKGFAFVKGATHNNNLFFTTNVNMNTGNRVRLNELFIINESFAEKLKEKFSTSKPSVTKSMLNQFSLEKLNNSDSLDNIGTKNQTDIFSYFTEDSLGISIFVGHALGGHTEFEIKYRDIINNIKVENDAWNSIHFSP